MALTVDTLLAAMRTARALEPALRLRIVFTTTALKDSSERLFCRRKDVPIDRRIRTWLREPATISNCYSRSPPDCCCQQLLAGIHDSARSSRCEMVQCGRFDDRNLPIWVNHASRQIRQLPHPCCAVDRSR